MAFGTRAGELDISFAETLVFFDILLKSISQTFYYLKAVGLSGVDCRDEGFGNLLSPKLLETLARVVCD